MVSISFPNWSDALSAADLPEKVRNRHRIIINWFLGHLKRESSPATKTSAQDFIEHLVETRKPAQWQVKQWTDGLNWFFREAPTRRRVRAKQAGAEPVSGGVKPEAGALEEGGKQAPAEGAAGETVSEAAFEDGRRHYAYTVAEMQAKVAMDPWYEEAIRLMRVRHMAYRTEETYLGWMRRMERFIGAEDPGGRPQGGTSGGVYARRAGSKNVEGGEALGMVLALSNAEPVKGSPR